MEDKSIFSFALKNKPDVPQAFFDQQPVNDLLIILDNELLKAINTTLFFLICLSAFLTISNPVTSAQLLINVPTLTFPEGIKVARLALRFQYCLKYYGS